MVTKGKVAARLFSFREALDEIRTEIDGLRDFIRAKQEALDQVKAAPLDKVSATRRIDAHLKAARARGVFLDFQTDDLGATATLDFNSTFSSSPFDLLASYAGPAFRETLISHLRDGGLSREEKSKRTRELEAEIAELALAEEIKCRELESAGQTVPRRHDAPPALLLAPDDQLGA